MCGSFCINYTFFFTVEMSVKMTVHTVLMICIFTAFSSEMLFLEN